MYDVSPAEGSTDIPASTAGQRQEGGSPGNTSTSSLPLGITRRPLPSIPGSSVGNSAEGHSGGGTAFQHSSSSEFVPVQDGTGPSPAGSASGQASGWFLWAL